MSCMHRCPYCDQLICTCDIGSNFFALTQPKKKKSKKQKRKDKRRRDR